MIRSDTRGFIQTESALVEVALVALEKGHPGQLAGSTVSPTVIATAKLRGATGVDGTHFTTAVATNVEPHAHPAILTPADDDRVLSHLAGHEIATLGDLRLVRHVEPAAGKDALHLQAVELRVAKDARADSPLIYLD